MEFVNMHNFRHLAILFFTLFSCIIISCKKEYLPVEVSIGEIGTNNLIKGNDITNSIDKKTDVAIPFIFKGQFNGQPIKVQIFAKDFFGKILQNRPFEFSTKLKGDSLLNQEYVISLNTGFYDLDIFVNTPIKNYYFNAEVSVIQPFKEGVRPNSFFSANTKNIKTGNDLQLLQLLGFKVQRAHFYPFLVKSNEETSPLDFTKLDKDWDECKKAGMWVQPVIGNVFESDQSKESSLISKMQWPPFDADEFVNNWQSIIKHYSDIKVWEFWDSPWINKFERELDVEEFGKLLGQISEMMNLQNSDNELIAGGSWMFAENYFEQNPKISKNLIKGLSHCPSIDFNSFSWNSTQLFTELDHGYIVSKRMGINKYFISQGGTTYKMPDDISNFIKEKNSLINSIINYPKGLETYINFLTKETIDTTGLQPLAVDNLLKIKEINEKIKLFPVGYGANSEVNSRKSVQFFLASYLSGAFRCNIDWEAGYGQNLPRLNASIATFNNLLEDRPLLADIWPESSILYGGIFANPSQITDSVKALPRANELMTRWSVEIPENKSDASKIAVLFCKSSLYDEHRKENGFLAFKDFDDIKVYDMTGNLILTQGNILKIPLTQNPVYLITKNFSVTQFRNKIRNAYIENIQGISFYATSLTKPATEEQNLAIRTQNQLSIEVMGILELYLDNKRIATSPFTLTPSSVSELFVKWPAAVINADNSYQIEIKVDSDAGKFNKEQTINVANFVNKTIEIDGLLDDWKNIVPVVIDTKKYPLKKRNDDYFTDNSNQQKNSNDIRVELATAYDNDNIYLAAKVFDDAYIIPLSETSEIQGDSLGYFNNDNRKNNVFEHQYDALRFAFGFTDRNPQAGRQISDPRAWKSFIYDTDYNFIAYGSQESSNILQLWGPATSRNSAFSIQTNSEKTVEGAMVMINRNDTSKSTIYEISIPRKFIKEFDPKLQKVRFGFVVDNNEGFDDVQIVDYQEYIGIPGYWKNGGSFGPAWVGLYPVQNWFGIDKCEDCGKTAKKDKKVTKKTVSAKKKKSTAKTSTSKKTQSKSKKRILRRN